MPPDLVESPPRVAFFTDTFNEANGVATLSRQLVRFAENRHLPFLSVHGACLTEFIKGESVETLELRRGPAAFRVDKTLYCDPFLTRHKRIVMERVLAFKPDLVHITGPGDLGFLGLWVAHSLRLPLVASWHTNLHEYLARRLDKLFDFVPCALRTRITHSAEAQALRGLLRFYRMARFTFAPSQPLVDLLHENTRRAAFLMHHGVDLNEFRPSPKRAQAGQQFCIGYVGRLTTEKNVRHFAEIDRALRTSGEQNYKFLIVGDGGQRNWLKSRVGSLEMTGVLRGEDLVGAYNRMDAFVFPSQTDTFGLVVLEAMASGIPVLVAPKTGACVGVQDGVSGFVSEDFVAGLRRLMHDRPLCHAMGCAARQFAAAHGWDVVFEDLYGTYAHALSSIQPVSAS